MSSGDWRPSFTGTRYHYGNFVTALCGATRKLQDDTRLRDKCAHCVRILKARKKR